MASQINAIDKQSVHKICSGQVVLDLATAVKELVENSIDAGATSVEIKFKDNGVEGFEVVDDGSGIDPMNYESLALKHYTSKLNNFEDLEKVMTFGFRGEALSSLCALCNLTVITATKEQAPMGVKLDFNMNGNLTSKTPIARSVGTTIQLSNIFHSLPVRQREFKRNIKREYGKALTIIQAYSIISANIRISVSNQSGKKSSMRVMSTSGNKEISANISNIFGAKLISQITPFKVNLESIIGEGTVEGFISKPEWGVGRSSSDRQYFFVNGRPCILPRMAKALNEIYRTFISNQYPVVIADLKIPTDKYDVNMTPDKRTILIHEENKIAEAIMEQLKDQLEPSRSTYQVNAPMGLNGSPPEVPVPSAKEIKEDMELEVIRRNTSSVVGSSRSTSSSVRSIGSFAMASGSQYKPKAVSGLKRSAPISTTTSTLLKYMTKKPKVTEMEMDEAIDGDAILENDNISKKDDEIVENDMSGEFILSNDIDEEKTENSSCEIVDNSDTPIMDMEVDSREYVDSITDVKSYSGLWKTVGRTLTILSTNPGDLLNKSTVETSIRSPKPTIAAVESSTLKNASVKNIADNEKATKALSRVISKPDFARMEILGQFNLGFMITSLDDQDLYIIDQHASDEKYNFETLQQTTRIRAQRLISPQLLDLTAAEELVVMDNIETFQANGFEVEVLPDNEPTKRIRVVSQPVSKNTMFDKNDFSEIIFLINEHPGEMVRCSRTRAMFASRACHKAARIGDSLNKRQMTKIVRHMGEIDQPWNCPHGRPTMRHLFSLGQFKQSLPARERRPFSFSGSLFQSE